jgi:hypothetical protein
MAQQDHAGAIQTVHPPGKCREAWTGGEFSGFSPHSFVTGGRCAYL